MFSNKDYAKMTLADLLSEEDKMKAQKKTTTVLAGVIVGGAIWSATHKGGFYFTVLLLLIALGLGFRSVQILKNIQAEISRRNTDQQEAF